MLINAHVVRVQNLLCAAAPLHAPKVVQVDEVMHESVPQLNQFPEFGFRLRIILRGQAELEANAHGGAAIGGIIRRIRDIVRFTCNQKRSDQFSHQGAERLAPGDLGALRPCRLNLLHRRRDFVTRHDGLDQTFILLKPQHAATEHPLHFALLRFGFFSGS